MIIPNILLPHARQPVSSFFSLIHLERNYPLENLLSKLWPQTYINMQVLKPVGLGVLSVIMLIGIFAFTTELMEIEEVAKMVVIPSLILLIIVTGYAMFQTFKNNQAKV